MINCSAIMPELETLRPLRVRVMLPDALITAIKSPPPPIPRVDFLTREYLLAVQTNVSSVNKTRSLYVLTFQINQATSNNTKQLKCAKELSKHLIV